MNAKQVIAAMSEAHRLIDSVDFVASPGDSEIVKANLIQAIDSINDLKKAVGDMLTEFGK